MAEDTRRLWDSSCCIAWLANETGRVDYCRTVLEAAEAGEVELYVSTLAMAETLWPRGRPDATVIRDYLRDEREAVENFFRQPYFVIVEVDRTIASLAQNLVWDHGVKPKDAVHVASAVRWSIPRFDTFDEPLQALSGKLGSPPVIIERPFIDRAESTQVYLFE
jgi:predicted nucleic acid-binding protein